MNQFPKYFHVGLMKTGTTSIQDVLMDDSRINLILKKKFFNTNLFFTGSYEYCKEDKVNIESDEQLFTIDNFFAGSYVVLKRIKEKVPDAHIIVTIREQKSLLISAYKHSIRFTRNYYRNFEDFLNSKEGNVFLYMTDYESLFKQLLNFFPKENIHILLFEDLKFDHINFYRNLYKIIGLEIEENQLDIRSNSGWTDKIVELKLFLNRIKLFHMGKRNIYLKNNRYSFRNQFKVFSMAENYIYNKLITIYSKLLSKRGKQKRLKRYLWGDSELFKNLEKQFSITNKKFQKLSNIDIYKYNYL